MYGGLNNKCSPRGSYNSIRGPQLVALFEEVMEPLGDGALLKEVNHRVRTFRLITLPYYLLSLYFMSMDEKCSASFLLLDPRGLCLFHHDGFLTPANISQNKHFQVIFGDGVLSH